MSHKLSGAVDDELDGSAVHAEIFIARNLPVQSTVITEGSLLIIKPDEFGSIDEAIRTSSLPKI